MVANKTTLHQIPNAVEDVISFIREQNAYRNAQK